MMRPNSPARDDVDVVVELIGGSDGPALTLARRTLDAGKALVTANKAMLAHHGLDLAAAAEASGLPLRYEAAVAGGIPIIKALSEGMAANRIARVYGLLNGTCNYILTRMETERLRLCHRPRRSPGGRLCRGRSRASTSMASIPRTS